VYWRWCQPQEWLFPSQERPEHPMSDKSLRVLCANAGRHAGLQKAVHPHVFRHALAYYTTFPSSFILKAIALGQIPSAAVYGHSGLLVPEPVQLVIADPFER
jgi:site-specific recombinase XerC